MKDHFKIENAFIVLGYVGQDNGHYTTISETKGFPIRIENLELAIETARILIEGGFLDGQTYVEGGYLPKIATVCLTTKGYELYQILQEKEFYEKAKDFTIETAYCVGMEYMKKKLQNA